MANKDRRKNDKLNANEAYNALENDTKNTVIEIFKYGPIKYMRRKELIDKITKKRGGVDASTVNRALRDLKKEGKILVIKYADFRKYGIIDSDRKAAYVYYAGAAELKVHMDQVFEKIDKSEDPREIKFLLKEINLYEWEYTVEGSQLNILISSLALRNDELISELFKIIFNQISIHRIKPAQTGLLLSELESLLKDKSYKPDYDTKTNMIKLLGIFKSGEVINQLKKDLRNFKSEDSKRELKFPYTNQFTARVIDDNKQKLLEFQQELIDAKRYEAVELLSEIRADALNMLKISNYGSDDNWLIKLDNK